MRAASLSGFCTRKLAPSCSSSIFKSLPAFQPSRKRVQRSHKPCNVEERPLAAKAGRKSAPTPRKKYFWKYLKDRIYFSNGFKRQKPAHPPTPKSLYPKQKRSLENCRCDNLVRKTGVRKLGLGRKIPRIDTENLKRHQPQPQKLYEINDSSLRSADQLVLDCFDAKQKFASSS